MKAMLPGVFCERALDRSTAERLSYTIQIAEKKGVPASAPTWRELMDNQDSNSARNSGLVLMKAMRTVRKSSGSYK